MTKSKYSVTFDSSSLDWTKSRKYNVVLLKAIEHHCNFMLKVRGHLLLNDVFDELNMPRTKEGSMVGWMYDEKHYVDNFICFDINERGTHPNVVLNFNVDGEILSKIY